MAALALLLAVASAGCSQKSCLDAVVVTSWDGGLSDGGTWMGGAIDSASCSLLCTNSSETCSATDGGVRCEAYCVP